MAKQCSFAKQNTGHGTNAAKKVAAAPADTYRRNGKPPLQIIVLKTQLLAFRRPFLRKIASRCSTGSVPRRVERSGRRRPPCAANGAKGPVRRQLGAKAQLFSTSCSASAENRTQKDKDKARQPLGAMFQRAAVLYRVKINFEFTLKRVKSLPTPILLYGAFLRVLYGKPVAALCVLSIPQNA